MKNYKLHSVFPRKVITEKLSANDAEGVVRELVGILVSTGAISESVVNDLVNELLSREKEGSTGIGGGVAYTKLHQTQFLGANAVAAAEGRMGLVDRKEDDYGNVIGTGIDMIFGSRRADWASEDATATANQSSLMIVNTLVGA